MANINNNVNLPVCQLLTESVVDKFVGLSLLSSTAT